jgi:hypothetical protein
MLNGMNSSLAELQARQALEKMRSLRNDVVLFATHAKLLNSSAGNIDSLPLLEEATRLLKNLGASRLEFLGPDGKIDTLARSLPSRPPGGVGMSPAAKWMPELRAASKQFAEAVRSAEAAVFQLRDTALEGLNSPTRMSTEPDNLLDLILNFTDLLNRWIEHRRKLRHG